MLFRTVIVDDSEIDLDYACGLVKKLHFLELVGAFQNPFDAIPVLKSGSADILICDVDMPEINGLSLVKSLVPQPQVIFTSSFPHFAVQGFEVDAIDYLVKPFGFERFLKAVNKAVEQHSLKNQVQESSTMPPNKEGYFYVRSEHRFIRVDLGDVLYVEALKDYVKIVTPSQTILTAMTLKVIEQQLPVKDFLRIHRSYIVNINKIEAILNLDVLVGGVTIPVGESYKEQLFNSVVAEKLIKR